LKLTGAVGPDFRQFGTDVRPGFERVQGRTFGEVACTWTPTPADTVSLGWRHLLQPAAGGRAVYDDVTYEGAWKRAFGKAWSVGGSAKAYLGDMNVCLAPPGRKDWIYTVGVSVGWKPAPGWRTEASLTHDWAESRVANTPGREYDRNVWSWSVAREF
jgi:hypothetical protein